MFYAERFEQSKSLEAYSADVMSQDHKTGIVMMTLMSTIMSSIIGSIYYIYSK